MLKGPAKRVKTFAAVLMAVGILTAVGANPAHAQKPDLLWEKAPSFWSNYSNPGQTFFSPDGTVFAFMTQSLIEVHRTADQQLLYTIPVANSKLNPTIVGFRGNDTFVTESRESSQWVIRLWRASDGALMQTVSRKEAIFPLPGFRYVLNTSDAGENSPPVVTVTDFPDDHVLFTRDDLLAWGTGPGADQLLAILTDGTIQILNLSDGSVVREISPPNGAPDNFHGISHISVSPDGTAFAVERQVEGEELGRVDLRRMTNGGLIESFPNTFASRFDAGGEFFTAIQTTDITTFESRMIVLRKSDGHWDPVLENLPGGSIHAIDVSADGELALVSQSPDDPLRLLRTDTGEVVQTFPHGSFSLADPQGGLAAFSPDGEFVVLDFPVPTNPNGRQDNRTTFWRVSDGRQFDPLEDYRYIQATAFSPDGTVLAGATGSREIRLWNAADGTLIRSWGGASLFTQKLEFSPDGQTLTATGDTGVQVWRVTDGELLVDAVVEGAKVVVSPDHTVMAVLPSGASEIELRRTDEGHTLLTTINAHGSTESPVAFTPDGSTLIVRSQHTDAFDVTQVRFYVKGVPDGKALRLIDTFADSFAYGVSDGNLLAVSFTSPDSPPDRPTPALSVYRVSDGTLLHTETYDNTTLALNRVDLESGTYLVLRPGDFTALLKDLTTGATIQTFPYEGIPYVGLAPDRRTIIVVEWIGGWSRVVFRSVETGQVIRRYDREVFGFGTGGGLLFAPGGSLSFSPDGRLMAYTQASRVLAVARTPGSPPVAGDVDASGQVDVADAVVTLRYIVGIESLTEPQRQAADVQPDGQITVEDVIRILRVAIGIPG